VDNGSRHHQKIPEAKTFGIFIVAESGVLKKFPDIMVNQPTFTNCFEGLVKASRIVDTETGLLERPKRNVAEKPDKNKSVKKTILRW
jgi:hypothetical protein